MFFRHPGAITLLVCLVTISASGQTPVKTSDDAQESANFGDEPTCGDSRGWGSTCCGVQWLHPWSCEDLQRQPFEPTSRHCGCKGLFWCLSEDELQCANGEANGGEPSKKGNALPNGQAATNGEQAEGKSADSAEATDEAEEIEALTPLMQLLHCRRPCHYERLRARGDNVYGWLQLGYTQNFASPSDRVNFGTNFNWRSNDFRLNQFYFVWENALEHAGDPNVGYRVDFYTGHNTPFQVANGLFSDFTGFDPTSGYGVVGPASFRDLDKIGIDLPQFYLTTHIPNLITEKGVDILIGKFWTLMGHEYYPATLTEFYSQSYEIIYATPFTHTGILSTIHATDTLDMTAGVVVGSDVFEDNNNRPSFTGNFVWNSCDKRLNWTTAWITGPEQFNNNDNYRSVLTSYLTRKFGYCNQWTGVIGGNLGLEDDAVTNAAGALQNAEWYGASAYLLYTVDPSLIWGTRVEWFRDDDGARTAVTGRPGFAASFYEATFGATKKVCQNLRIRPEVRFDWAADGALPYNDQTDSSQTTLACDLIWEY